MYIGICPYQAYAPVWIWGNNKNRTERKQQASGKIEETNWYLKIIKNRLYPLLQVISKILIDIEQIP